jgi:paraquat-inducible protein A
MSSSSANNISSDRRLRIRNRRSRNVEPWNSRTAAGGKPPAATVRASLFHRHGRRLDVLGPLALATAILPLALLLPVVHFSWALKADTTFSVLTGTFDLLDSGHTFIGLLILTFSIIFPTTKILALYTLWFVPLPAARTGSSLRWLEFLGKWSMLDVFVVGILVGTLDLGILAETTPRVGAYVFTGMVLLSMAATLRQIRWARTSTPPPSIPARPSDAAPAVAAMAVMLLAAGLTYPLLEVDKWTFWSNEFSILGGPAEMVHHGYLLLAATLMVFVIAAPILQVLAAAGLWAFGSSPRRRGRWMAAIRITGRWAMADVFSLGIVVVVTKLGGAVNVTPRPGLWFFLAGAGLASGLCGVLAAPRLHRHNSLRGESTLHTEGRTHDVDEGPGPARVGVDAGVAGSGVRARPGGPGGRR